MDLSGQKHYLETNSGGFASVSYLVIPKMHCIYISANTNLVSSEEWISLVITFSFFPLTLSFALFLPFAS